MHIEPIENFIVVERIKPPEKKGSIVIPHLAQDLPKKSTVLAVGPGKYQQGELIPMPVEVGDVVLHPKICGHKFDLDGKEVMLMRVTDVFGILKEDKKAKGNK